MPVGKVIKNDDAVEVDYKLTTTMIGAMRRTTGVLNLNGVAGQDIALELNSVGSLNLVEENSQTRQIEITRYSPGQNPEVEFEAMAPTAHFL